MRIESKHILAIILVSVAILGQVVVMYVFRLSSPQFVNEIAYTEKQTPKNSATCTLDMRKGELVGSEITES